MKKILFIISSLIVTCLWVGCKDTETYADLVDHEKGNISRWIKNDPFDVGFGNIIRKDEDWVSEATKKVLNDSVHPKDLGIELGQWYEITEGDFKRLHFRINSWGKDNDSKKKFHAGKDVLVRYDSLYLLNGFDYEKPENNAKGDNLDPLDFLICYGWNTYYYASMYYGSSYGSTSSYACTSGGLAFPIRFLWEGGNASIICPFSLVESSMQSYYYTLYYGDVTYLRPTYTPN